MLKRILPLLLIPFFLCHCALLKSSQRSSSDLEEDIRALLKEHPEIVLEVLEKNKIAVYQIVQQGALADSENQRNLRWNKELESPYQPEIGPDRPVRGYSKAPIVIVSYSNFLCSYCKSGAMTVERLLKKYPEKLRLVFKHLAYDDFAEKLGVYFEAIGRQSDILAWKFHDKVFENQEIVARQRDAAIDDIVASLKINRARLAEDLRSAKLARIIEKDRLEAESFGFGGTPVFLINGVSIRGAVPEEDFEKVIEMVE